MKFRLFFHVSFCILATLVSGAALFPQPAGAAPAISISPKTGVPGTKVTVAGSDFTSYAGERLYVVFNNVEVGSATVSNSAAGGIFRVTFQVPARTLSGNVTISIRTGSGNELAQDIFTVPTPDIRLGTWGGIVNTPVTVDCRGFSVGKPVTFRYQYDGETEILSTQTAGETGECVLQIIMPASPRGTHTLYAENTEGQSATAEFEIIPSIAVEPQTAAAGDRISITGTGFTADNEITVSMNDRNVAYARTTARGSFTAQFIVPVVKAGTHLVGVEDFSGEVKWDELMVTSRIALSKKGGEVGARITVEGTGFETRSLVVISYDSQTFSLVSTDDTGAFEATIAIPASTAGSHLVSATDGTDTKQMVYTVESEAPIAPEPLSPKRSAVVTMPLTLDWESVYDVSQPLFYSLQIARSPDFFQAVFWISGLDVSHYILIGDETLLPNRRGTYYYWRVNAIDSAGNVGEWSEPVSFHAEPNDSLPQWTRYILITTQVIIAIVFAILVWRGVRGVKSNR